VFVGAAAAAADDDDAVTAATSSCCVCLFIRLYACLFILLSYQIALLDFSTSGSNLSPMDQSLGN